MFRSRNEKWKWFQLSDFEPALLKFTQRIFHFGTENWHIFHSESDLDQYLPRCSSEASSTSASWTPSPPAILTTARLVTEVVFRTCWTMARSFQRELDLASCSDILWRLAPQAINQACANELWMTIKLGKDGSAGENNLVKIYFSMKDYAFDWFGTGEVDLELFNAVIEDLEENALKNKQRRRREVRAGVWECGERSLLVSIKIDENFWVCAGCAWVDPDHIP